MCLLDQVLDRMASKRPFVNENSTTSAPSRTLETLDDKGEVSLLHVMSIE